jgi:hypothetical protein
VKSKTLVITLATLAAVVVAAAAALFTLNALARSYQTCGKVHPAALRTPADPGYAATLERLARCGH